MYTIAAVVCCGAVTGAIHLENLLNDDFGRKQGAAAPLVVDEDAQTQAWPVSALLVDETTAAACTSNPFTDKLAASSLTGAIWDGLSRAQAAAVKATLAHPRDPIEQFLAAYGAIEARFILGYADEQFLEMGLDYWRQSCVVNFGAGWTEGLDPEEHANIRLSFTTTDAHRFARLSRFLDDVESKGFFDWRLIPQVRCNAQVITRAATSRLCVTSSPALCVLRPSVTN